MQNRKHKNTKEKTTVAVFEIFGSQFLVWFALSFLLSFYKYLHKAAFRSISDGISA